MTFLADNKLDHYIKKKTRGSFFGFLSLIFLFFLLSEALYYKASSTQEYMVMLIGGLIICCGCMYSMTIMEGAKLNKLVNEITIVNDKLIFTTYAYKWLLNILKPKTIELNRTDLSITEVDFPFNSLGLTDNRTYCITLGELKIYICYDVFQMSLKQN